MLLVIGNAVLDISPFQNPEISFLVTACLATTIPGCQRQPWLTRGSLAPMQTRPVSRRHGYFTGTVASKTTLPVELAYALQNRDRPGCTQHLTKQVWIKVRTE